MFVRHLKIYTRTSSETKYNALKNLKHHEFRFVHQGARSFARYEGDKEGSKKKREKERENE